MILKNMTTKQAITSKAILAGLGLIALGGYLISQGNTEIGLGVIMNGLGYIGIRDNAG